MLHLRRVAALAAATSLVAAAPAAAHFHGAKGYALDAAGNIHTLTLGSPGGATVKAITGVPAGSTILGIDERPKTGALYALVRDAAGQLSAFLVNPATGAATPELTLVDGTGAPVAGNGSSFGVDFNPVADALRITSDAGQNLRVLPSDRAAGLKGRTFVDGALSYDPITASPRATAGGINASAYTQNLFAPTTTTLFNIDSSKSALTTQTPPNDGTQVKKADLALGGRPVQGFDILTNAANDEVALAVLGNTTVTVPPANLVEQLLQQLGLQKPKTVQRSVLVEINESTGALGTVGAFATNGVVDLAVDTPAP